VEADAECGAEAEANAEANADADARRDSCSCVSGLGETDGVGVRERPLRDPLRQRESLLGGVLDRIEEAREVLESADTETNADADADADADTDVLE